MTITPKQIVVIFNHLDRETFIADLPEDRTALIKEDILRSLMYKCDSQITFTTKGDKLSIDIPTFGRYTISEKGNMEFTKTLQIYPNERYET